GLLVDQHEEQLRRSRRAPARIAWNQPLWATARGRIEWTRKLGHEARYAGGAVVRNDLRVVASDQRDRQPGSSRVPMRAGHRQRERDAAAGHLARIRDVDQPYSVP